MVEQQKVAIERNLVWRLQCLQRNISPKISFGGQDFRVCMGQFQCYFGIIAKSNRDVPVQARIGPCRPCMHVCRDNLWLARVAVNPPLE